VSATPPTSDDVAAAHVGGSRGPQGPFRVGRMFVNPLFDYLLIGGGLSVLVIPFLPQSNNDLFGSSAILALPALILFANSAHFASSTVRLYTKEGMFASRPFYTMAFPLVSLLVVLVCIAYPEALGRNFYSLYLTWSPYHYAAQSFGLAAMYGHRSGSKLNGSDMRLLWWTAMLPFFHAFLRSEGSGLAWFVPATVFVSYPPLAELRSGLIPALRVLALAMPLIVMWRTRSGGRPGIPLISIMILVSNGIWWVVFSYLNAFGWATLAHATQYLAIVMIFHIRENPPATPGWQPVAMAVAKFYGICVMLGYLLFQVLPYAYVFLGFPLTVSMAIVTAAINIHHFVIDRVVWRQRKDSNYKVVVS
jgi:hypothetical protein